MPFAAALSEHPIAAHAVGEVAGELLERLGPEPDLAALFVTGPHTGTLEDIAASVQELLAPRVLIGATAVSVVGGAREVEETPGLSLWAGRLPGRVTGVRLTSYESLEGRMVSGLDPALAAEAATLLLLPDPFSFPVTGFLAHVAEAHPHLRVIGGLASAARGPGGNRLVLDGTLTAEGAVGALLDVDASPLAIVSQGCRPIGQPFIVTRAERHVLYELGGRPALERLLEIVEQLPPEDRALAAKGLHCGVVIDERKPEFGRGDFLIRNVLGADRDAGAVAVGEEVAVGSTVQFQVRDAASADEDLRLLLGPEHASGALLFTCNGRGTHLFGTPDHDAAIVSGLLGTAAVGGMFCAGELGPVGGQNHLHGFTASVALFRD